MVGMARRRTRARTAAVITNGWMLDEKGKAAAQVMGQRDLAASR